MTHPPSPRRTMLANAWAQMFLVIAIVVLANMWSSRSFVRMDLTADKLHSLDLATRGLMTRLERPMTAKVYFTDDLQAPYNNHKQILVDTLDELAAYSQGLLDIQVADPTGRKELTAEARAFGIDPIQYRYRSASLKEMKQVHMGVALIYGDRQEVLPAVTQLATLEYDLARAIKNLVSDPEPTVIGWATGHGEPDIATAKGPLERIRERIVENHSLGVVPLGGPDLIPDEIDALMLVGPQEPYGQRALYQIDQFLMRGGSLAIFPSNVRPNMRAMRPQNVIHGLEPLLAHYGVTLNHDLIIDRVHNGELPVPVKQGRFTVQVRVNYPLIPRATELHGDSIVVKDLDSMLFPFASSLDLVEPLPPEIQATVLAASHPDSSRLKGIRTLDPSAFQVHAPGEEVGSWPMLMSLSGEWTSFFADKDIPAPPGGEAEDAATKLRRGAPARLIVSGSADFVANNVPFVLNLADWMVADDALVGIRSKVVNLPALEPLDEGTTGLVKLANLLGGTLLLILFGLARFALRRRTAFRELQPTAQATP